MAGPSPQYLAEMAAAFNDENRGVRDLGDVDAPGFAAPPAHAPAMPPPVAPSLFDKQYQAVPPPVDLAAPPAAAPAPAGPPPPPQAPAGPPPGTSGAPPIPQFNAPEPDVQTRMVRGAGAIPAHEAATRGPIQNKLLEQSFVPPQEAAMRAAGRAHDAAQHETDVYEQQAAAALKQQDVFQAMAQKRALELEQMRNEYMGTIQKLSEAKIDNNRLWANSSTGDRIGAIALTLLGNSEARAHIQKKIDDDVKLQQWDYQKNKDVADGQHTAYAMAMQQFGSEDAAYAAATAAGQAATAAKIRGLGSTWKGTETQNQMDLLAAGFQHDASQSAAAGWKFIPAQMQAPQYRVAVNGFELPAPVTGAEANKITLEHGAKAMGDAYQTRLKGGIDSVLKAQEARAKGNEKADEGAAKIASMLQQAGVPAARANAELALQLLNKSPGGVGEAALRGALPDRLGRAVAGDDANAREDAYNDFVNAAIKATAGNATASEEIRVARSMGSVGDPEGRKRAIGRILGALAAVQKNAMASAPVEAQSEFLRRQNAAEGGPPTAPKGVTGGWK